MTKRTTVTLTARDLDLLEAVADPSRPEAATLRMIADELGVEIRDGASESALIRVLLAAGAAAVQQRSLEQGYAELAALYPEAHDADEAAERRRRYANRVDAQFEN